MRMLRYHLGRSLVHAGIRVMPSGRVKSELYALIDHWSTKVRDTIATSSDTTDQGRKQG